jgi:glutamate/aspartate transport system substrate-binding protein
LLRAPPTYNPSTGKKIAVVSGTTNERAVTQQNQLHNLNLTIVAVKSGDEGVAALEVGRVDGYASDKLLLVGAHMKNPGNYTMLPDDLSIEPYGIALPRGDWALRLAVNTGLAEVYRSGMIVAVFKKWFDQLGLQPGVLSEALMAQAFPPLVPGNPAAGSAKGTGADAQKYYAKCVANGGNAGDNTGDNTGGDANTPAK